MLKWTLLFFSICITAISCSWISRKSITSQYYKTQGELIVLTYNGPTTYYEDNNGRTVGFEHDLIREFARTMKVQVRFVVVANEEEVIKELKKGHAHLAATATVFDEKALNDLLVGPSYLTVREQVICHRKLKIKEPSQLKGRSLLLATNSSTVAKLDALKKKNPGLQWTTSTDLSPEEIISRVWNREVDCTVTDSLQVKLNKKHYPEIRVAFDVSKKSRLKWVMGKEQQQLYEDLVDWFDKKQTGQVIKNLYDRYFGYAPKFDFYDTRVFERRVKALLPKYQKIFEEVAHKVKIDWKLLAAIGYQESHWNPSATSPTGVRGLMMLTNITAKEMGVENRLDPRQSIDGGARYIRKIMDRFPLFIEEKDRLWFTIAAYNIGWGHLMDARKLAIELNKNPNSWDDVRSVLPLLSKAKYYKHLRHGYARGYQPVIYAARIQRYYDILQATF